MLYVGLLLDTETLGKLSCFAGVWCERVQDLCCCSVLQWLLRFQPGKSCEHEFVLFQACDTWPMKQLFVK